MKKLSKNSETPAVGDERRATHITAVAVLLLVVVVLFGVNQLNKGRQSDLSEAKKQPVAVATGRTKDTASLAAPDIQARTNSGGAVLAFFMKPGEKITPDMYSQYADLLPIYTLPAGTQIDIRPGSMAVAKTHFKTAIKWPVVLVSGPRGHEVFSSPLDTAKIRRAIISVTRP